MRSRTIENGSLPNHHRYVRPKTLKPGNTYTLLSIPWLPSKPPPTMPRKGKNYTERMTGPRGECELCHRTQPLTEHHLIPRAVHGKKFFQKRFTKEEMTHRRISICRKCHKGIHRLIPDEKTLAREYNTKELLLAEERVAKHVAWVARQK